MLDTLFKLLKQYEAALLYVVFGVLTTIINVVAYMVCYNTLGMPNLVANAIAWFLAIVVAFITNKLWVFNSKSLHASTIIPEFIKFLVARLATGALDMAIMFAGVDAAHLDPALIKVVSNVVVIVLNFVLSKLYIFKDAHREH